MKILKQIKLLYLFGKLYNKIKKGYDMKKLLEREFILSVATLVASIWAALAGLISAELMIKIMAWVSMVYAIARAIVKFTPSKKDDEILKQIEGIFKGK